MTVGHDPKSLNASRRSWIMVEPKFKIEVYNRLDRLVTINDLVTELSTADYDHWLRSATGYLTCSKTKTTTTIKTI